MTAPQGARDIAMTRVRSQLPVLPSLLDRLIDDEPDQISERAQSAPVLLRDIKVNLRRDLEWLLNTRLYRSQDFSKYPELQRSLIAYGLPDFSTVQLGSDEHREQFRAIIQATIERLEPRLRRVQVEISPLGEAHERTLYLRINAVLLIEPDPVPLLFDSRIRGLDRTVQLQELRHG